MKVDVKPMRLPLLRRYHQHAGSITALGLLMLCPLTLVPETLLSYHWAALAGAFVKANGSKGAQKVAKR